MDKPNFWYGVGRGFLRINLKIWHQAQYIGQENIPTEGGVIVASNHISHLDPPGVGSGIQRTARFVAKEELFQQFFLKWFFPAIGVIPIKRGGGGKEMLSKAAEVLDYGGLIIMFPEGTRSRTGHPQRPRSGILVLAAMTGACIVPARISGSYDCMPPGSLLPRPGKIQVAYGEPIKWAPGELDLNNRDQLVDETRRVMDIIHSLPGWTPKKAKPLEPNKPVEAEKSTQQ